MIEGPLLLGQLNRSRHQRSKKEEKKKLPSDIHCMKYIMVEKSLQSQRCTHPGKSALSSEMEEYIPVNAKGAHIQTHTQL